MHEDRDDKFSGSIEERDRLCCVIVQRLDDDGYLVEDEFVAKSGRLVSGTFWHATKKYSKAHKEWQSRPYKQIRKAIQVAKSMNDHGARDCPRCHGPRPVEGKYRDHCPGCHRAQTRPLTDNRRKHKYPPIGWLDGKPLYPELPE